MTRPAPRAPTDRKESRLRLQTGVRLRWFAVFGQLVAISVVHFGLGFALPIGYCLSIIALSAWLNVFLRVRFPARHRLSAGFATTLLAYDILQLGALLYLTGGIDNPFVLLLVAPVTVSASTLPSTNTIALGLLAALVTIFLVPFHLPLPWYAPGQLGLPPVYKLGILASVLASMGFLGLYAWRLSKEARQMSAALAATELVLAREQRLHALDGLAAAAAHELGTPLSTIVLVTKEMEEALGPGHPQAEDVALLRSQAQRCRDILQKLTRQPSEQDPMHAHLTVVELIEEAARPYRKGETAIRIDAPAVGDNGASEPLGERRPGVIHGIGNLIENAADFARSKVDITARWSASEVTISIADDGPGIPEEIIETLGEPYVTTRPGAGLDGEVIAGAEERHSGLGLGFFIAKTLLERSGADVTIGNRETGTGAIVRVRWTRPAFEGAAAQPVAAWPGRVPKSRGT